MPLLVMRKLTLCFSALLAGELAMPEGRVSQETRRFLLHSSAPDIFKDAAYLLSSREDLVNLPDPKGHRRRNEVLVAHSKAAEQPQLLAQGRELLAHCGVVLFERLMISPWVA